MPKAAAVFGMFRALLDDLDKDNASYPDPAIVPYVNLAIGELEIVCLQNPNINRMKTVVTIPNVAAGTTNLADQFKTGGALELCTSVISMKERQAGGLEGDYIQMEPCREIFPSTQVNYNGVYYWGGDTIRVRGALQALDFRIFGNFDQKPVENADSAVIPGANVILSKLAAGEAASARVNGAPRGTQLKQEARGLISAWMGTLMMELQDMPSRPMPFGEER